MIRTNSTARAAAPAFLALACVGFIASAPAAHASDPDPVAAAEDDQDAPKQDRDIVVTGQANERQQAGPKATRTVRDTPQTVTVITGETIGQQNLLTLRDVLSTVPGITFGAGEGGGGYGDSITLRGYSANTDITIDGVRDSAQYSRSDPFNLEQIEVVNGANSVYGGSGSVGGSINIVSKRPLTEDRVVVSGGIGTDNYYRGTVDANLRLSGMIAVRLNGVYHSSDVPGRDVETSERWGIAPSLTLGVDGPVRLTFQYLHQQEVNTPQYGVPYYQTATNAGAIPGVDRSDYFGYRNLDTQEINLDQATVTLDVDLGGRSSLRNLTRWQDVTQLAIVDPPQGTYCLSTNLTPTGAACTATIATQTIGTVSVPGGTLTIPAGYYLPSGPRGNTRDSRNQLGYNQLDFRTVFNTGGVEHTLVIGASATWEKYNLSTGNMLRNTNGTAAFPYLPLINFSSPNDVVVGPAASTGLARVYGSNVYTGPVNYIESARQEGELENYAIYAFDTVAVSRQLEFNAGVRLEKNRGWFRADTISTAPATLGAYTRGVRFENEDTLFSYRVGLVFKPVQAISLYAAYGNSKTPSKTSVNGSCTAATCSVDPESAVNYEIGAKAELFNGGLLLTAAAFRNERTNYKVASNDPAQPDQTLDGQSRVDGFALGAVGKITPQWTISANYTYLDGTVLRSVSEYCLTHPGPIIGAPNTNPCGNTSAVLDPGAGAELQQTPRHSGSLFTTYTLPFGLTLGYGFTYQGDFALNTPVLATPLVAGSSARTPVFRSESYMIHNAYVSYAITPQVNVQVNVKNLTDEEYYTRVRNNGWATPGEGRSATFTVTLGF